MSVKSNRFLNDDIAEFQNANRNPIYGYQDLPIMTLEKATASIVPLVSGLMDYVVLAKQYCNRYSPILTWDESAAIYLYSMQTEFFSSLNKALRDEKRHLLKPWFPYLKLFLNALERLPFYNDTVWRGVSGDFDASCLNNDLQTWWSVNSCSKALNVIEAFVGGKGVVFAIKVSHGKDISAYTAMKDEQEVILMPGATVRMKNKPLDFDSRLLIVHLEEEPKSPGSILSNKSTISKSIPEGKHVMLSYNWNSHDIVSKIYHILRKENIPVWFDANGDMKDNMYESLADGVENAVVICCFITSNYEESGNCKLELQYAQKRYKTIIPCILDDANVWKPADWLEDIVREKNCIDFRDFSESNMHIKSRELIDQINEQYMTLKYRPLQLNDEATHLFELIREEYKRNSRIERLMDPTKSFPIEESYINLSVVESKEEREKEKKLRDVKHNDMIMDNFENIYGTKTPIVIKDIFKNCKGQSRKVLIFGRAGIGKTTFCRYAAHQWATAGLWPEYDLVVLFSLRSLTENRYPPLAIGNTYSLGDVVEREYFGHDLTDNDKKFLKKQLNKIKVLWLLDGYDEIAQSAPRHLQYLFEQVLKTPHHIMTSRPYLNDLSYVVRLEITGFTDENITKYVNRFFEQIQEPLDNTSNHLGKCFEFLKRNSRIWGIAHIPVNLELICCIWCETDWVETRNMTITGLYDNIIEWLLRRYLARQNINIQMTKEALYLYCCKELTFLESLAYEAIVDNTILIRKESLQKVMTTAECSLQKIPNLLNIGILKSFDSGLMCKPIETEEQHYFVHMSFQEHFAARYLVFGLQSSAYQKCIEFIKAYKYNPRFTLTLIFVSGLLIRTGNETHINTFWTTILEEPRDLIGLRHLQLLVSCMDESECSQLIREKYSVLQFITNWLKYIFLMEYNILQSTLERILKLCTSLPNESMIQKALACLLESENIVIKVNVLSIITQLQISNLVSQLTHILCYQLKDYNPQLRKSACLALGSVLDKVATTELIDQLLITLDDNDQNVRSSALEVFCKLTEKSIFSELTNLLLIKLKDNDLKACLSACRIIGKLGKKVATSEMINRLVILLGNSDPAISLSACQTLGQLGEKAATSEVINQLLIKMKASYWYVRWTALQTLITLSEKTATNEMIIGLAMALVDSVSYIRSAAYEVLGRLGRQVTEHELINPLLIASRNSDTNFYSNTSQNFSQLDEKVTTSEEIIQLLLALEDHDWDVRSSAYTILTRLHEMPVTSELTNGLLIALEDNSRIIRLSACRTIGLLDEKIATNEMINRLAILLDGNDRNVCLSACRTLGQFGEKAATSEVINQLVILLKDSDRETSMSACDTLGQLGEKAATSEVLNRLAILLDDNDRNVCLSACRTLGQFGEKAATSEVINRLAILLKDSDRETCTSACKTLRQLGGNAATSEVVSRLLIALENGDWNVRFNACRTIGELGEKAITIEVITKLFDLLCDIKSYVRSSAGQALDKIGRISLRSRQLQGFSISEGSAFEDGENSAHENLNSRVKLFELFMEREDTHLIPSFISALLFMECAVVIDEQHMIVFGKKESIKIKISNDKIKDKLINNFCELFNKIHVFK
ncbi:unnamed protein product [Rotaria magnacalcarata]